MVWSEVVIVGVLFSFVVGVSEIYLLTSSLPIRTLSLASIALSFDGNADKAPFFLLAVRACFLVVVLGWAVGVVIDDDGVIDFAWLLFV